MSVILWLRPMHWHCTNYLGFTASKKKFRCGCMKDVGRIGHNSLFVTVVWRESRYVGTPTFRRNDVLSRYAAGLVTFVPGQEIFFWGGGGVPGPREEHNWALRRAYFLREAVRAGSCCFVRQPTVAIARRGPCAYHIPPTRNLLIWVSPVKQIFSSVIDTMTVGAKT
jgi:hypothetical protein